MTTTPAPLDLDTLRALEQAATRGPWVREWAFNTHFVVPEAAKSVAADNVSRLKPNQRADAELIAAMRNALPALLALASTCTCAQTSLTYEGPEADCLVHGAVRALNEAVRERDAAREELAKTSADNERLRGRLSQVGQRLHATLQHLSAEAEDELRAAWTAEDEEAARRGFAKRMTAEMANPANTAEPADEPKATCHMASCPNPISSRSWVMCDAHLAAEPAAG